MKKQMSTKGFMKCAAIIAGICLVISLIGGAFAFVGVRMQKARLNEHRLDMLNAYRVILEENKDRILAYRNQSYIEKWQYRLSHNSVKYPCCLYDVDRDEIPELLFFTFDDEFGSGTLHIYSYENCRADEMPSEEADMYLDMNVGGGSDFIVYTGKDDSYLHVYSTEHGEGRGAFVTTYKLTSNGLKEVRELNAVYDYKNVLGNADEELGEYDRYDRMLFYEDGQVVDSAVGRKLFSEDIMAASEVLMISNQFERYVEFEWEDIAVTSGISKSYKHTIQDIDSEIMNLTGKSEKEHVEKMPETGAVYAAYKEFLQERENDITLRGDILPETCSIEYVVAQDEYRKPVMIKDIDNNAIPELLVFIPDVETLRFDLKMYTYTDGKVKPVRMNMTDSNTLLSVPMAMGNCGNEVAAFSIGENRAAVLEGGVNYDCVRFYECDNGAVNLIDTFKYGYKMDEQGEIYHEDFLINDNDWFTETEWRDSVQNISDGKITILMDQTGGNINIPEFGELEEKVNKANVISMSYEDAINYLAGSEE